LDKAQGFIFRPPHPFVDFPRPKTIVEFKILPEINESVVADPLPPEQQPCSGKGSPFFQGRKSPLLRQDHAYEQDD